MKISQLVSGMGILCSLFVGGIYVGISDKDNLDSSLQANLNNTSSKTVLINDSSKKASLTSQKATFFAEIVDILGRPIDGVMVKFIDPNTNIVIAEGITNKMGFLPTELVLVSTELTEVIVYVYKEGWKSLDSNVSHFYKTEKFTIPHTTKIILSRI